MLDVDTPRSPSPASLKCRTAEIERELLAAHGPLHVPDRQGREHYFPREHLAIVARRAEAERRAMTEASIEGQLRSAMAELEAAAAKRARLLERHGLADDEDSSLDAAVARNKILGALRQLTRRVGELEREPLPAPERWAITPAGLAALGRVPSHRLPEAS